MRQITLPATDIRVSRIAFGTASLHHLFSATDRLALLCAARDAGVTHFDTSPYYGYGLAEADLGRFICGQRLALTLSTKVGLYPWGYPDMYAAGVWVRKVMGKLVPRISLPVVNWQLSRARASLEGSLRRLRTEYVDFLLLHEPDRSLVETDEILGWLAAERDAGRVREWGLAGVAERVAPFVVSDDPLAKVVQTQDSMNLRQAEFLRIAGRELQFTYGYLSSSHVVSELQNPDRVLRNALERNHTGSVLVSTRRIEHIKVLARVAV